LPNEVFPFPLGSVWVEFWRNKYLIRFGVVTAWCNNAFGPSGQEPADQIFQWLLFCIEFETSDYKLTVNIQNNVKLNAFFTIDVQSKSISTL
jgi:hypothetical protein